MLERKFRGPWQKAFQEASRHKAEFAGNDIELTVTGQVSEEEGEPLDKALKGYIGIINSGKGHLRLSENTGEKFRSYLEEKRRKGHL